MATPIPKNGARFTAWDIAAATNGTIVQTRDKGALPLVTAVGITSDSREVVPGSAFVALRGETYDGHDFLAKVVLAGASVVVVGRGRGGNLSRVDAIEVDDTLVAWGAIARAHLRAWRRARPVAKAVVITGSAGKTTTKEICAALLDTAGVCHRTAGNLNNRIGLPAVVMGLEPTHAFAVLEAGMSVRGEIAALAQIVEPDVAVLLNVGVAHAAGVGGTRADVAHEKGALFEALAPEAVAVVNADDPAAMGQITRTRARRVETFGRAEGARWRLLERESLGVRGSRVVVSRHGKVRIELEFPLIGEAAALDLVAALAAAEAANGSPLSPAAIQTALSTGLTMSGRGAIRVLGDGTFVIDDSYNANPQSMRSALGTLREIAEHAGREAGSAPYRDDPNNHGKHRAVAILGEMKELGVIAQHEHDAIGAELAASGVALAIGCGGLIDRTLDRAAAAGITVHKARSTEEAAEIACREVRAGDVVLVKGSRSVGTEKIVEALVKARGEAP